MIADTPLWTPSPDQLPPAYVRFVAAARAASGAALADYDALHAWSIADPETFWSLVWDQCGVIGDKGAPPHATGVGGPMRATRFFPNARLNFAETLLHHAPADLALIAYAEGSPPRRISGEDLRALVSRLQQALHAHGVGVGDRVAAILPNGPEAIAAMLATVSMGAVWSSCSPDFGVQGVLDRFGQIEPTLLFGVDGYGYGGKSLDVSDKLAAIVAGLPSLRSVILVPHLGDATTARDRIIGVPAHTLPDAIAPFGATTIRFERLAFTHPLVIAYSSGTTGAPKCIVHGAGGTLLQHLKEQRLHCGIAPGDRVFYFSTLGWMMWNWLASALGSGATLVLYDGNPFYPNGDVLWTMAEQEGVTLFGTSAKYLDTLRKSGLRPRDHHDLSALRLLASTGSPLAPDGFSYVYDAIKPDLHLASISGGTDIISCFVLGIPGRPVFAGEIQGPGLGMAVEVWDEDGRPLGRGEGRGELVCTRPFPSMPIEFRNDPGGARYTAAYFERFEGIWCHGDFAEWTPQGGMIIHGRSDATLNPGGVRIGTAELYAQVETIPEVVEALAIGQSFDNDVRIVLFVRLAGDQPLTPELVERIRHRIRTGASPRHLPARIVAITDIPRTKSGKITELAVRDIIHGRPVKNREALANPEALDLYVDLPELRT